MPPSPASRCSPSPSRELRRESHRRGRSLEGGLALKEKDDDLALFSELQSRERVDFLVQSVDDFEDAFTTKLRRFSDNKVGITIPARGESSDLLNADGEKNDYEWLLTPPDTPLFPSLDDEPILVNAPPRGRQRSQPISISRSSTMEKSYRSSRGSASPSRSSLSPRSGNSTVQSRAKPSSSPHTSPISNMRSPIPTRRASPPPSKGSTPTPRSSSPTPRRMSTGSNAYAGTSGVRGTSPGKVTRGNSSSPKIRAWQANIPGFSCDVPPNLRTSLADRPASYVRGSSPASRNGRDSSSKTNRQSMSPTPSRSVSSSSYSHDRDWLSSRSKGSVASSGDDEVDSVPSVTMGALDQSTPRKVSAHANSSRSLAFSRKPAKLSSSAPKRSFDPMLRQMDNRKAPQNMFRPLLSSVPSTTFYAGKASSAHSIISRHSSITSSSNTSSDQGTTLLPDPERNYYNQDTVVGDSRRPLCSDVQDEVFAFDKEDGAELGNEIHDGELSDLDKGHKIENGPANFGDHSPNERVDSMCDPAHVNGDLCEVDHDRTLLCSLCGCIYDATDHVEMDMDLCRECMMKDEISHVTIPVTPSIVADESFTASVEIPEERQELDGIRSSATASGSTDTDQSNLSEIRSPDTSLSLSMIESEVHNPPDRGTKATDAESAGISLLLKRSGSSKGIVVQGRTMTASTISFDDLSYARDSGKSMRSSIGHCSVSSSSSIDLSSSRQTDMLILRQLSGKKSDSENFRDEVRSQNTVGVSTSTSEDTGNMDCEVSKERAAASQSNEADTNCLPSEHNGSELKADSYATELSIRNVDVMSEADSMATLEGNVEDLQETTRHATDMEVLAVIAESPGTDNATMDPCSNDALECSEGSAPGNGSLVERLETEAVNGHQSTCISEVTEVSPDMNDTMDEHQDPSQKDVNASTPQTSPSDTCVVDTLEESTVTVEGRNGTRSRSLTLDEATDTILFCSSIVHDLAYSAATIAMEKQDQEPFEEGFRPTVTIVGRPTPERKDPHGGRIVSKRGLKPHRARPKRLESDRKIPSSKTENDENFDESLTRNVGIPHKLDSEKPPRLESKCNCTIM